MHGDLTSFYKFLDEPDMKQAEELISKFIDLTPEYGPKLISALHTITAQLDQLAACVIDEVISNVDKTKAKEIKAYLGE